MNTYEHRSTVDHPPQEVFRWHGRPGAFGRLLPPWEDVRILERTGGLEVGTRVRLQVRRGPTRFEWVLEHTEVEEGRLFVDEQVSGPFGSWRHVHRFEPADGGRCHVVDEVHWDPPLGKAASLLTVPLGERELERLFSFRHRRLRHDLDRLADRDPAEANVLTVAVTGASGLVGRNLAHFLRAGGHRVVPLVRSREAAREGGVYWSVEKREIDSASLEGIDAMVHLAGEPLFALRWTEKKKEAILESRRRGTRLLADALVGLDRGPRVLVSASGVHVYGDRGDEILTEESPPENGDGFLAKVCREWERATHPAVRAGIRVVLLRSGLVVTPEGGALNTMLLPFRLGLGGRLGSGKQYLSWIDADDHLGLVYHALRRREVEGPLNAVAPDPVPSATFTDTLGRVLRRPTLVPLPRLAVKVGMGEMGEELLLKGQRVRPEAALATGFRFHAPHLEECLRHQLGRGGRGEGDS